MTCGSMLSRSSKPSKTFHPRLLRQTAEDVAQRSWTRQILRASSPALMLLDVFGPGCVFECQRDSSATFVCQF